MDVTKSQEVMVRPPDGSEPVKLRADVLYRRFKRARLEGMGVGLTSGVLAGYLGRRYFRFKNVGIFLTGFFTCFTVSPIYAMASFKRKVMEEVEIRRRVESSELIPDELLQDPAEGAKFS